MNVLLYHWDVEKIAEDFLNSPVCEHIDISVVWGIGKNRVSSSPMTYRRESRTIHYLPERIVLFHKNFPDIEIEDFVLLMLIHEIGHHLHWEAEEDELLKINHENEHNENREWKRFHEIGAWNYGRVIVPTRLQEDFDRLNVFNLKRY
ncbi:metallopeptidase family protein [Siminovitchia fordii]|uniref:Uncharacterized protein n=1 Tax=Siminovitchia fordii TaxID=254759 RepID=A0ABQ4KAH6_9BACI|nr:metallopeptidase family protein [Siminovitchia fordii]GIN22616.1 hypothetical protein J1TS3_37500 [Siminovitchia fordii]